MVPTTASHPFPPQGGAALRDSLVNNTYRLSLPQETFSTLTPPSALTPKNSQCPRFGSTKSPRSNLAQGPSDPKLLPALNAPPSASQPSTPLWRPARVLTVDVRFSVRRLGP